MTRIEALKALLAKVEAGDWSFELSAAAFPPETAYGRCTFMDADEAYNGSLDAAKALHEAVLPGWAWSIKTLATGAVQVWTDYAYGLRQQGFIGTTKDNASRAWLLAILKALIGQEESA
ncbi:hypothetical protein [Celeribacter naphthalenivorans]|uniref:hypothetical protein n=1 Tax=Celeribacter naphthalenivorans TaxID=1614694 RepID=UPI001CF9CA83|nr:hypothetical protein [Celeribacter naphthalenivorans]